MDDSTFVRFWLSSEPPTKTYFSCVCTERWVMSVAPVSDKRRLLGAQREYSWFSQFPFLFLLSVVFENCPGGVKTRNLRAPINLSITHLIRYIPNRIDI